MKWQRTDQRREFALKALGTLNFSGVVPGVRDQRQDGLQMARKVFTPGARRDGGRFAAARSSPKQLSEVEEVRLGRSKPGTVRLRQTANGER